MKPSLDTPSFSFTEDRVETALRLMQKPDAPARKVWRDDNGTGLHLRAGKTGGTYYWIAKRQGKRQMHRIGDATTMRLSKARDKAKLLAGGDMKAKAKPIRVTTSGPPVIKVWEEYLQASRDGSFYAAGNHQESQRSTREENFNPHIRKQYGSKSLSTTRQSSTSDSQEADREASNTKEVDANTAQSVSIRS